MSHIPISFNLNDALPKAAQAYRRKVRAAPQPNNTFGPEDQVIIPLDTTTNGCFLDTQNSYLEFVLTLNNTNPYIDYHSFGNAGASAVFEKIEIQVNNITIETLDKYSRAVSMFADINGTASDDFDMFVSRPHDECVDSLYNRLSLNSVKKPMVDRSGRIMHANTWANSFGIGDTQPAYAYSAYTNVTGSSKTIFPSAGITRGDINYITGQVGLGNKGVSVSTYSIGEGASSMGIRGAGVMPSDDNPLCWPEMIHPCVLNHDRNIVNHNSKRYHNQLTTLCNVRNVPIGCQPLVLPSNTAAATGTVVCNSTNSASSVVIGTSNEQSPQAYAGFYNWSTWVTATTNGVSETTCFAPGQFSQTVQVPLYSGFMGVMQEKHLPMFMCGDLKIVATLANAANFFTVSMDPCRRIFGTHRDWCPYQGNYMQWRALNTTTKVIGYPSVAGGYVAAAGSTNGSDVSNLKFPNSLGSSGAGVGNVLPWNSFFTTAITNYVSDGASAANGYGSFSNTVPSELIGTSGENIAPNVNPGTPTAAYFNGAPYLDQWLGRMNQVFSPQMYKAGSHIPQYFIPSLNQVHGWVTTGSTNVNAVPANCWQPPVYNSGVGMCQTWDSDPTTDYSVFIGYDGEQCFGTFLRASVPQVHRCFWNGLLSNSTTFTQQYTNQSNRPTFALSSVYYVQEQVLLNDELTAKILSEAVHADMSLVSKTFRTYQSQAFAESTSQYIQIPVKIASCDSLYMLFQVNEMFQTTTGGTLGATVPYCYDSTKGVCPFGAYNFSTDGTSFIGTTNDFAVQYVPTTGSTFTAQLILGNDVVPQQPYSSLAEMATELVKTGHGWTHRDSLIRLMASVIPKPVDTGSTTTSIVNVFDIFNDMGYATTWVSPFSLNDETIVNNAAMQYVIDPLYQNTAPIFSGQVPDPNSFAVVTAAGSGSQTGSGGLITAPGTTLAHAAGPMTTPNICATPVGGYMINQFTVPRSTFILGFDLNSMPGANDVCTSGRYLGSVPTFLSLTGALLCANLSAMGNPANLRPSMTMLTLAICDMRSSFQTGGVVNSFI